MAAKLTFELTTAVLSKLLADVNTKLDQLKQRMPDGAVSSIEQVQSIINDVLNTGAIPTLTATVAEELKQLAMTGRSEFRKAPVDLA